MATDVHPEWRERRGLAGRVLFGFLRLIGHMVRLVAFSVLVLLAPFIRVILAIAALGIPLVCLVERGEPHRHPFPYAQGITIAIICAVLYVLLDRVLIALAPEGTKPKL